MTAPRETFASRFSTLATMVGAVVGLGSIWRFPYMVGKFGGLAFVLVYIVIVLVVGIPGLMAEWTLGRVTRRGTVGAFERGGFPAGRAVGWFFFLVVTAATAYYTNVIGWVVYHAIAQLAHPLGLTTTGADVLPPDSGFSLRSFVLQAVCTLGVILACVVVLLRGVRSGIERVSTVLMPILFLSIIAFTFRALTLPNAIEGLRWFILKFDPGAIDAKVVVAALGQVAFSLSLGGTFMVVYGSYLRDDEPLGRAAAWTAFSDTAAGMIAGFAIFPAVFALGLEPGSGPGLLFATLPRVFAGIPAGWMFGALFFIGIACAGYLSDISAFEVLIVGLTDNTKLTRKRAVWIIAAAVFVLSLPPMISMKVFLPWDLTFGSGMQTLGALLAVLTVGWSLNRAEVLRQLARAGQAAAPAWLYWWLRLVVPGAILAVGVWWLATSVLGLATGV